MVNLFINGELLDQYADESVDIVSSVLDVSDITKNTGDYSKSFTVPASKNNNRLFKHWYNASIDNGFDARSKVEGSIDIDGVPFKLGKWRLNKCNIVKGRLESYTINFFGNLPNISDTIGEDLLSDLSFPALNHEWTSTSVIAGLQGALFGGDLAYTLMANKRYFYNSHSGAADINDTTINIANAASTSHATGVVWSDLRPSVKLSKIIEAIEAKYNAATYENPIVFSRDFFSTTEFAEQYLWLKADEKAAIGGGEDIVDFTSGDETYINLSTNIGTFTTIRTGINRTFFLIKQLIQPAAGYENVPYTLVVRNADTGSQFYAWSSEQFANGDGIVAREISLVSPSGTTIFNLEWYVKSNAKIVFSSSVTVIPFVNNSPQYPSNITYGVNQTLVNNVIIGDEMPELKIVDFLKGIFNMFKLVAIPKDDGSIYVNTLDSYYAQGQRYDATKYIDFAKFDVDRGELLKRISFEFEEPSTIMNMQFQKQAADGQGYGASLVNVYESLTPRKLIDGDTLEVKLPFEQIYFERLVDQNTAVTEPDTNIQTGVILDDNLNQVVPKAVLHYVTRQDISATPIRFVNDLGVDVELNQSLLSPIHHFGVENPMYSNLFEAEFSNFTGETLVNNLYSIHYEDYITAIFELKRRTFMYTANLPIQIVTRLDLNDVIAIGEIDYRINKYSYNLLNGLTKLELINGFDTTLQNRVYIPSVITLGKLFENLVFNVEDIEGYTVTKIDDGFGTSWATTSIIGTDNNLAGISVTTMGTGVGSRSMIIRYVKDSITTDITIVQNE